VVRPVEGFFMYNDIQAYVRSQLPDGYIVKEKAPVRVAAATQEAADATAALLKSYGYNVVGTAVTAGPVTKPVVVDLSGGSTPYTLHYLKTRFGGQVTQQLPSSAGIQQGNAKFVILVPNE